MSIFTQAKETVTNLFSTREQRESRQLRYMIDENDELRESLSRLQLDLENEGYRRITSDMDVEFQRHNLDNLTKLAMTMAIKNPIICRMVNVQADYVFSRGVRFVAAHPLVQQVIDEHTNYCENQKVLYSHDSMSRQEREFQVNGNLFFALLTNPRTGRVTVRDIPTTEITEIFRDPDDYHTTWFYKRAYVDGNNKQRFTYHPALGITEGSGAKLPDSETDIGEIQWTAPIYHAAFNRYGRMKFGMPEIYSSMDWARVYRTYLEDWTTIMRSFARMAMKITGLGGSKQAAAAKSKLQTGVSLTNPLESNPTGVAGSTALFGKGVNVEPVKTAGSTTAAKEGQPLLNMAAAGVGLPNTFFGDASQARGDSLDRPTEIKMLARQRLWSVMFGVILDYVVYQSALCKMGYLSKNGASTQREVNQFNDEAIFVVVMPNNEDESYGTVGEPISISVGVKFPELLERNVTDRVRALVNAVTQFGKPLSDIIPDKRFVCRLLLEALNVEGIDAMLPQFVKMWEDNMAVKDDNKPVKPYIIPPLPAVPAKGAGAEDPSQGGDTGANG